MHHSLLENRSQGVRENAGEKPVEGVAVAQTGKLPPVSPKLGELTRKKFRRTSIKTSPK